MTSYPVLDKKDTRSGFGEGLLELGRSNPDVVGLCADLTGSLKMDAFEKEFPDRFIQCGVAEANMMGVAAGLTIGGKIPFTGTFANFSTGTVVTVAVHADHLVQTLTVGEVRRGLRRDLHAELVGDGLGEFGVGTAREQHQVLLVVSRPGHRISSTRGCRGAWGLSCRVRRRCLWNCRTLRRRRCGAGRRGRPSLRQFPGVCAAPNSR